MQEVAAAALGAGTPEEQPADGRLPALDGAELAADWPAGIPAAVEQSPGPLGFLHAVVLDVDVPPQVWLEVAADAQLAHGARAPELPEQVPEEVLEVGPQLPLVRLQGLVAPSAGQGLQRHVPIQAPKQQRPARSRHRVRPRAAVSEAAGPGLEEEGARLLGPVRDGGRRVVPALPAAASGRRLRGLGQLCQDLLQAVLLGELLLLPGWGLLLLLLLLVQAAGKLALCLRLPLQPQLVLALPLRRRLSVEAPEEQGFSCWQALGSTRRPRRSRGRPLLVPAPNHTLWKACPHPAPRLTVLAPAPPSGRPPPPHPPPPPGAPLSGAGPSPWQHSGESFSSETS